MIAFASVYLVWGSTYLAIRFTLETLPVFLTAGVRFLIAGAILYAFARLKQDAGKTSTRHWRSAFIVGGFLLAGGNGSVVWAEQVIPSGLAALIVATTPLWMVLLEWLWRKGKRPSASVLTGIAIGFSGVAVLILPDLAGSWHTVHLSGVFMLLAAAFFWATGSVYSRTAHLPDSPFLATGMEMMAGGVLLILMSLAQGEFLHLHFENVSFKSVGAFLYLIFFGSLVGFTAYIWLLKKVGVTRASTYAFVNPVVAVILGSFIAHEELTGHILLAASLILFAVVMITAQKQTAAAS